MIRSHDVRALIMGCVAMSVLAGCGGSLGGSGTPASSSGTASGSSAGTAGTAGTATGSGPSSGPSSAASPSGARFTDPATAAAVRGDVRSGVEAVNSYDYRSLDAARRNGLRWTTGALTSDFERTSTTVIAKNAPGLRARQTAHVSGVGVNQVDADSAEVLVFGTLDITTTTEPKGRNDPFAVTADARLVSGRWRLSKITSDGSLPAPTVGTPDLRDAATAATGAASGVTTFHRSRFDTEYARVLSLLTGRVRDDVAGRRAKVRSTLDTGGFDLEAEARAAGVERATGARAVVLVAIDGYQVTNGTRAAEPSKQYLRVTVQRTGGRWLVSDIESVS